MMTGYSTYSIDLVGYRFLTLPPITLNFSSLPAVERVEIFSPDDKHVTVKVHFLHVTSHEDADSISRMIATQVTDRLAFQYLVRASDPMRGESRFEDQAQPGVTHTTLSHSVSAFIAGHEVETVESKDLPQLRPFLQDEEPNKDLYYSQFRWIMLQDDPVTKFMHLYKILLSLEGGPNHAQRPVDNYIVSREPGVQMIFNPNPRVNRDESIYTRLRNEVGHEIAGVTPATTRQGMEQHVDKLADHVKAAFSSIV